MLTHLDPASALAIGLLIFALILVIAFEATNGFHDAANAVATVIYTRSLTPVQAVMLSGILNFLGVLIGGISVAYALVELLPAEVLSPPSGAPAVGMLVALFVAALFWNIGTWWLGLPNSSSHCLIGAILGVAFGNALVRDRSVADGAHWSQVGTVLKALALSPLLGAILSALLYLVLRKTVRDKNLYKPAGEEAPVWWMRGVLIFTCSAVSFAHGTNDGQKSIGLIMLTIIGLFPALFALNPEATPSLNEIPTLAQRATPLIDKYGDDEKQIGLDAARRLAISPLPTTAPQVSAVGFPEFRGPVNRELGLQSDAAKVRSTVRNDLYQVVSELKYIEDKKGVAENVGAQAKELSKRLGETVEYAPWWVRILSALCLGIGTMIGYRENRNDTGREARKYSPHAGAGGIGRVGFRHLDRHFGLYRTSGKHHTHRYLRDYRYHG